MNNIDLTPDQAAQAVRAAVARHPLSGTSFRVWEEKVMKLDNCWRVPLVPSPWPERLSPIYEVLAEVEGDLQDEQGLDVLLSLGEPVNVERPLTAV